MDLGGLHGFNGSLLDPMKMTDAELLDNGDDDDDVMNGVLLGSNSSVLQTPDKLSLEGQESGGEETQAMLVGLSGTDGTQVVEAMAAALNPGLETLRNTAEREAKDAEVQRLAELNSKLNEANRELKDKVDLHEDELTDLREQFVAIEKENEAKGKKVKCLEITVETLQANTAQLAAGEEALQKVKQLEEKIEKDKVDAMALQKRNQDAIGNKNQKIATLNEELGKVKEQVSTTESAQKGHESKVQDLQLNLDKTKEENVSLTKMVSQVKAELEENKTTKLSLDKTKEENVSLTKIVSQVKAELEETKDKAKEGNVSLAKMVSQVKAELEESKTKGVSAQEKETEMIQLQKDIETLRTEVSEGKLSLEKEVNKFEELVLTNKKEEKLYQTDKESFKVQLEEQKTKSLKMQSDLKEANEAVQDKQMALTAEKDKLAGAKADFEQEKSSLVQDLSQEKAGKANLLKEKENLLEEKENLSKDNERISKEKEDLVQEKETLSKDLTILQKQTSEQEVSAGDSAKISEEKKALSEKCNKLEMEAFDMTRTCNELKQKVTKLGQLEEQMKEMEELKGRLASQNNELQAMRAETHTAKEQNSNLLQSNEKLIQTAFENRTSQKNAMDNLSRECTTLKKALNDKEKVLVDNRRRVEELEKSRSNEGAMAAQMIPQMQMAHSNEVQQLKRQIETLSGEVGAWQKWKMEDEKQKSMTNSQVESLTKVLVETKQESLTFKKEADMRANEVQNTHMRIAELSKNLQMKIHECDTLKAIEKGMEKVKKETDHSRAEAEAFKCEAAKYRFEAEKSDRSQKELAKEATKMLKMLQDKDELLAEKDKVLRASNENKVKDSELDRQLQESRKDYLILEKESQFQKKQVEQTKREVEFLKKENFKLDKELQKTKKDQPLVSAESSDHLQKELDEVKRQFAESSSELSKLEKENTSTSKKIIDLEKQNKKLTDNNKQLNTDLEDEKAKVMVLCELREEEEEFNDAALPKTPKNVRAPPRSEVATEPASNKNKAKKKADRKSMPAKMRLKEKVEDEESEESPEEPDVSLIQVTKEEPKVNTKEDKPAPKGQVKGSPKAKKVKMTEKTKKPMGNGVASKTGSNSSSQSVVEVNTGEEPEVNLVPVAKKRGRPEKDPVQEVMEYLARMEKKKARSHPVEETDLKETSNSSTAKPTQKAKEKKEEELTIEETKNGKTNVRKGSTGKRKADEESSEQPPAKRGKGRPKTKEEPPKTKESISKEKKEPEKPSEPVKSAAKPVANKAKTATTVKKGKAKAEATKKVVEEPEVLAPRKGKGTKAAAIIAAITESSDHEAESDNDTKKSKGKKKTEQEKKVAAAPAKKAAKKAPSPKTQKKTKKR